MPQPPKVRCKPESQGSKWWAFEGSAYGKMNNDTQGVTKVRAHVIPEKKEVGSFPVPKRYDSYSLHWVLWDPLHPYNLTKRPDPVWSLTCSIYPIVVLSQLFQTGLDCSLDCKEHRLTQASVRANDHKDTQRNFREPRQVREQLISVSLLLSEPLQPVSGSASVPLWVLLHSPVYTNWFILSPHSAKLSSTSKILHPHSFCFFIASAGQDPSWPYLT